MISLNSFLLSNCVFQSIKLYKIEDNTYIADTPGFSTFDINEIEYRELYKYVKEVKKYTKDCEYLDCTHIKEENCGVKIEVGKNISESRYNNYTKIYKPIKKQSTYIYKIFTEKMVKAESH